MSTANLANETLLEAIQVDKSFGITHAVNQVSLKLYRGEIRGLIGENGSGKSTFCSLLTGIHKLDGGRFLIRGGAAPLFCRRAALTNLCGQRPHLFLPQGEALSAPHSLFPREKRTGRLAVQEKSARGNEDNCHSGR